MSATVKLPSEHESELAQAALGAFETLKSNKRERQFELKSSDSKKTVTVTLPAEAVNRFLEVLAQMANGNAVTIVPVHAEFTTQQAADFLNVSRPFLIGLLEQKKLPYRMVGSHRRVRFVDLQAFKDADDRARAEVLAELSADAQAHGHGY